MTEYKDDETQRTDGDSSASFLLPLRDNSASSSPAAIASMEAAMPELSFLKRQREKKGKINHEIL